MTFETIEADYRRDVRKRFVVIAGLGLALGAVSFADLASGPTAITARALVRSLFGGTDGQDRVTVAIIWGLRLPATLTGILVGASLGSAGLQMQTILDNPLASPFTLGFSAAAGFGAALAILFGAALPGPAWLAAPAAAFVGTLAAAGAVYAVANARGMRGDVLVLAGVAVLFLFQSAQSLLQFLAAPEVLQQIVFWLFGSLQRANWASVGVLASVAAVTTPYFIRDAWRLTALRLGDREASSIGIDVTALRRRGFVLTAILTATAVAFTGTIGFVGLIAPHAGRALVGEDQRFLLPASALAGALILLGASYASKVLVPGGVLPVGIVTALTGVPVLFWLIVRPGRSWG